MMANFLEQLVAEWYEIQGYFVRRNVKVGRRPKGGWDGELDVVAFHPRKKHLIHIEPSTDALPWGQRQKRFEKKFDAGRKYIPALFEGLNVPPEIEQIALLGIGSSKTHSSLGGGRVMTISEFMNLLREDLKKRSVMSAAIPEQFQVLRALQFAAHY